MAQKNTKELHDATRKMTETIEQVKDLQRTNTATYSTTGRLVEEMDPLLVPPGMHHLLVLPGIHVHPLLVPPGIYPLLVPPGMHHLLVLPGMHHLLVTTTKPTRNNMIAFT